MRTRLTAAAIRDQEPFVIPAGLPVNKTAGGYEVINWPTDDPGFTKWQEESHEFILDESQVEEGLPYLPRPKWLPGATGALIALCFVMPPIGIPGIVALLWWNRSRCKALQGD